MGDPLPTVRIDTGRHWTLAEASEALPRVRDALVKARLAIASLREAEDQLQDLRIVWGDQVLAVACPDHGEWVQWRDAHLERRNEVEVAMLRFEEIGCVVKDVEVGLIDFRCRLGTQDVYLCWKEGEDTIGHYHAMDTGFANRRPIPGLPGTGGATP